MNVDVEVFADAYKISSFYYNSNSAYVGDPYPYRPHLFQPMITIIIIAYNIRSCGSGLGTWRDEGLHSQGECTYLLHTVLKTKNLKYYWIKRIKKL